MYAIIATGGKQYKVAEGDFITVEKLGVEAGSVYDFSDVLMVNSDDGLVVGEPYIPGAKVSASVIGDGKEKKVIVYKYKSKKGFHTMKCQRQPFTKLKIEKIIAG
jgi:large subunit ribosomal protein L21